MNTDLLIMAVAAALCGLPVGYAASAFAEKTLQNAYGECIRSSCMRVTPATAHILAALCTAILYGLYVLISGASPTLFGKFAITAVLMYMIYTDVRAYIITNSSIAALFIIRAVYLVLSALLSFDAPLIAGLADSLIGMGVLGAGTYAVGIIVEKLTKRDSVGGGDIKLFAAVGFAFGMQAGLAILFMSCILALLLAPVFKRRGRRTFPFAPAIATACIIFMLL